MAPNRAERHEATGLGFFVGIEWSSEDRKPEGASGEPGDPIFHRKQSQTPFETSFWEEQGSTTPTFGRLGTEYHSQRLCGFLVNVTQKGDPGITSPIHGTKMRDLMENAGG